MKRCMLLLLILAMTAALICGCDPKTDGEAGAGSTASIQASSTTQSPSSSTTQPPSSSSTQPPSSSTTQPPAQLLPLVEMKVNLWDLTEEERARMGAATKYYPWGDSVWDWLTNHYVYAQFGDVYVTDELKGGFDTVVCYDYVNGLLFTYPVSIRLNVLVGDQFYPLPEAYEKGFLTEEQLLQVHINYHGNNGSSLMCREVRYLPEEIKNELYSLVQELYSPSQEELEWWGYSDTQGIFGYIYVLYEPIAGEPDVEIVEGLKFEYPDGTRLFVYYEGEVYSLQEAVDRGLLTVDHLQKVLENHTA